MKGKFNITFYNLLFVLGTLAAAYYNGVNFTPAKYAAMGIFGLLFVFALAKASKIGINPLFKKWAIWILIAMGINLLYEYTRVEAFPMEVSMPLMIAFSATYLFTLDYDQLRRWFIPMSAMLAAIAVMSVIYGIGSFTINENSGGLEIAKNQIGPCFSTIAIVCYIFAMQKDSKLWVRAWFFAATVLNLYPPLYMGSRAALLSFFVVAIFVTFREYKVKGIFVLSLLVYSALIIFGKFELMDSLYTSFVGGRNVNDFSDMTSGRDVNMKLSWDYFGKHPIFGFYGSGDDYSRMPPNAHIFLLNRITKWGLFGAVPYLALYFSIFRQLYRSFKMGNVIVFGVLFVAIFLSFAEYAAPFGPGSTYTLTYLILGMFLRKELMGLGSLNRTL